MKTNQLDLTQFEGREPILYPKNHALVAECRRLQAENERLRGALEYVASSGESWTDLVNHARTELTAITGDWGRAALNQTE